MYQTLLDIRIKHDFYQSGLCHSLEFRPTCSTSRLLDNCNLLLKKTDSGIQIIYQSSSLEILQAYAEDEITPLQFNFKVYACDPYFKSYSEPYADLDQRILYFSNQRTQFARQMCLTQDDYASSQDRISSDAPELLGIIGPEDSLLPPEFVIHISALTEQGLQLKHWLAESTPAYTIAFKPRERYWKYYLLGGMAKENYYILDQDRRIEFDALGQVKLADRKQAYAFRSRHRIPLNDYYAYRFQLKERDTGGERVVINRLPVASISHIGKEVIAEQEAIVSEIYING
jgi:hypothetical protein